MSSTVTRTPTAEIPTAGTGTARVPLTCGELVQGRVGDLDFLVSCPIDIYARAEVWLGSPPQGDVGVVCVSAPFGQGTGTKAALAVRRTLDYLGTGDTGAWLRITNPLPPGKGLGTSTADIVAAAVATARAAGQELTPAAVARIALSIEPSDGVMFPGLAVFDHRRGRAGRSLGDPPPAEVLIVDFGGEVDTAAFNGRPDLDRLNRAKERAVRRALALVIRGIKQGNPRLIGEAATISALAHQPILPKRGLERLAAAVTRRGALGVVTAHSGTVAGILVPPGDADTPGNGDIATWEYLVREGGFGSLLGRARLIGGGWGD